jgi:hypothetical protein
MNKVPRGIKARERGPFFRSDTPTPPASQTRVLLQADPRAQADKL